MSIRSKCAMAAVVALSAAGVATPHAATGPQAPSAKVQACATCHGEGGNSRTAGIPSIAAQPKTFLETQLILFREGVRPSPVMQPIARDLSDSDIASLSQHFAASAAVPESGKADAALAQRGRDLSAKLQCGTCHLPDFRGRDQIPRIAGQREDYLSDALIAFRDNKRIGGDTVMSAVVYGASDADLRALAHFLARER